MSHKIIALWGSAGSGKTLTSVKLATELAMRKKNVVLVFADRMYSSLTEVIPLEKGEKKSLGEILSAPMMTQENIISKCVTVKNNNYISMLGYMPGENIFHYADYTRERAVEFLVLLRHMVDFVIVDCSTTFVSDTLSTVALEMADTVFRFGSATSKSVSYFDANLPILASTKFRSERHIKVLANIKPMHPKTEVIELFGGVHFEINENPELEEQVISGELLKPLKSSKSKAFNRVISGMADLVDDPKPATAKLKEDKIIKTAKPSLKLPLLAIFKGKEA